MWQFQHQQISKLVGHNISKLKTLRFCPGFCIKLVHWRIVHKQTSTDPTETDYWPGMTGQVKECKTDKELYHRPTRGPLETWPALVGFDRIWFAMWGSISWRPLHWVNQTGFVESANDFRGYQQNGSWLYTEWNPNPSDCRWQPQFENAKVQQFSDSISFLATIN